jgi:hypothetical protein
MIFPEIMDSSAGADFSVTADCRLLQEHSKARLNPIHKILFIETLPCVASYTQRRLQYKRKTALGGWFGTALAAANQFKNMWTLTCVKISPLSP